MSRKRNEYLDISEEEEVVTDSEIDDQDAGRLSRIPSRSNKKRKLSNDSDDSESDNDPILSAAANESENDNPSKEAASVSRKESLQKPQPVATAPSLKLSNAHQKKKKKTGVIYLSRIPPFMKPSALRHLLAPYGTLLRVFLTPESTPAYSKRVKSGGNKKRSFVDGWVEFASKKAAKICAETLNGNIIGGKKGGWYHDDIWNIKYLKGFKWDDLMEQVQDEERVREGRLRAEILMETKARKAFLENVEADKVERTRAAKRRKRLDDGGEAGEGDGEKDQRPGLFQNKVKQRDRHVVVEPQDEVKRVLSKIF